LLAFLDSDSSNAAVVHKCDFVGKWTKAQKNEC